MSFRLVIESEACRACRYISADGEIRADTPEKWTKFVEENDLWDQDVIVLNSPGGSLVGGLQLGRLIRLKNLSTHVGPIGDAGTPMSIRHECASSCAYVFLGGVKRSISGDGRLGFHRFSVNSSERTSVSAAVETTQDIVTEIAQYGADMGVTVELVQLATSIPSDQITWLTPDKLLSMKVVNAAAPYAQETWTSSGTGDYDLHSFYDDGSYASVIVYCKREYVLRSNGITSFPLGFLISLTSGSLPPPKHRSEKGKGFLTGLDASGNKVGQTQVVEYLGGGYPPTPREEIEIDLMRSEPTVSFQVDPKELASLARDSSMLELVVYGDFDFSRIFGRPSLSFPATGLADIVENDLEYCLWR